MNYADIMWYVLACPLWDLNSWSNVTVSAGCFHEWFKWVEAVNFCRFFPYGCDGEIWLFPQVVIQFYLHDFWHLYSSLNYWFDFNWKISHIIFISGKITITYYRSIGNYCAKKISPRYSCLSKSVSLRSILLLLKQEINKC